MMEMRQVLEGDKKYWCLARAEISGLKVMDFVSVRRTWNRTRQIYPAFRATAIDAPNCSTLYD